MDRSVPLFGILFVGLLYVALRRWIFHSLYLRACRIIDASTLYVIYQMVAGGMMVMMLII